MKPESQLLDEVVRSQMAGELTAADREEISVELFLQFRYGVRHIPLDQRGVPRQRLPQRPLRNELRHGIEQVCPLSRHRRPERRKALEVLPSEQHRLCVLQLFPAGAIVSAFGYVPLFDGHDAIDRHRC